MDTGDKKWEELVAHKLVDTKINHHFAEKANYSVPYMISITGIPGSGKSISARLLKQHIEDKIKSHELFTDAQPQVLCLQMDGFHYYRHELDQFEKIEVETPQNSDENPNSCQAHYYRGAYWTFNSKAFLEKLRQLKDSSVAEVKFPSFDHAVKDPEEDTFIVSKCDANSSPIPTIIIGKAKF